MKKLFVMLKSKGGIFAVTNFMALMMVYQTINATCFGPHHQPKVPDAAKKLRKF